MSLLLLVLIIQKLISTKKIKSLLYVPIMAFSLLISFLIIKFNVSERLILMIKFPALQKQVENYIANPVPNKNIRVLNDYVGIIWDPGLLDYYSIIIYDKNNNLDLLYKGTEETFPDKELYKSYKETFKYEKITSILKIKDCYFRCSIIE